MAESVLQDLNGDFEIFEEVMVQMMIDIGKDLVSSEQVEIKSQVASTCIRIANCILTIPSRSANSMK